MNECKRVQVAALAPTLHQSQQCWIHPVCQTRLHCLGAPQTLAPFCAPEFLTAGVCVTLQRRIHCVTYVSVHPSAARRLHLLQLSFRRTPGFLTYRLPIVPNLSSPVMATKWGTFSEPGYLHPGIIYNKTYKAPKDNPLSGSFKPSLGCTKTGKV